MSDDRKLSLDAEPGTRVWWKNATATPVSMMLDYGAYGSVRFNLPINGTVQITLGTMAPEIFLNDVEADVPDGDNVVRLKDQD